MTTETPITKRPVPRVTLTPAEAAESIGCSPGHFATYIDPQLPWIRTGRKRFTPVSALEEWASREARPTL